MARFKVRALLSAAGAVAVIALLVTGLYAATVDPDPVPQSAANVDLCPVDTTRLLAESDDLNAGSVSDGTVTVTFDDVYPAGPDPADANSAFDWTLDTTGFTVMYVIVMDGNDGGNSYDYRPDGSTTDDFLTTPGPDQGDFTFKGIGRVDFCYAVAEEIEPEPEALTAVKNSVATFETIVSWGLIKTVAPDSHDGNVGDTFISTWTVVATKNEIPGDRLVQGEITITNPNQIEVLVEVEDALDDGTLATVTCPGTGTHTGTAPANGQLVCTYMAVPDDTTATLNTAVITSLTEGVEGATATSPLVWTEVVVGDDEVLLDDRRLSFSQSVSESTTQTFTENFDCPAEGTFTHDNTAILKGAQTDLTANASVSVECDDIQRPSIQVQEVRVGSAANGSTSVTGSFVVKNMSGGSVTLVTIDQVTVSFISRLPGGIAVEHSANCTFSPEANGYVLQPHEARQFTYTCTLNTPVPDAATELTAKVTVGTATNQLGELRGPFSATSREFRFGG